jgi:hypothetical protein
MAIRPAFGCSLSVTAPRDPFDSPTRPFFSLIYAIRSTFGCSLSVTAPRDPFDSPTRPFFSLIYGMLSAITRLNSNPQPKNHFINSNLS